MKCKYTGVIILFTALGLHLAGCSGSSNRETEAAPIRVEVTAAQPAGSRQAFAYSGTIEAAESIPLSFATVGHVASVHVAEGDAVRKGQLLAALNDESSRNACEMALATLKQAEDACARLEPMYKNGNLAEVKWVEMETNLHKARSAAAISKKNLEDCKLYAPVNGLVGVRAIEPGMGALPNIASITIVKTDKVFARVAVPEHEIALMQRGQKAVVTIGALGDRVFAGAVEEIGVVADPLAHAYKVRIGVHNPQAMIKPGMICSVRIEQEGAQRGLLLPGRAVLVDERGRRFVYIVDDRNRAMRREVETGDLLQDGIAITSGLASGDLVVVAGQHKLVDQATVQIINR